jgi:hypothetical protein
MRGRVMIAAGFVGASSLLLASSALAQEAPSLNRPMAAPSNAFELNVGTGYTQGFGLLTPTRSIRDVAGAGLGAHVGLDYRFDPRWSIGIQGEYQEFAPNTSANTAARGLAANVGLTYHARPFRTGDPFVRLGTGSRLLWSVNPPGGGPTTMVNGFELAKASFGLDYRFSPGVAIAPVVGVDVDLWAWQQQSGVSAALSRAQVGSYIFLGVQGRFDFGVGEEPGRTVAGR